MDFDDGAIYLIIKKERSNRSEGEEYGKKDSNQK